MGALGAATFQLGAELTSGMPDQKEGLYFGAELAARDPRAGLPLHGQNLFLDGDLELRETVLEYIDAMTALGHSLMTGLSLSLGLERRYFQDRVTGDPLVLFRIFNYPALGEAEVSRWSVGEHTDYGLITLLLQDDVGGLQVKSSAGWMDAPPIPNSFVCNLGDMLDRMTGGRYRSTPHRVRNAADVPRMSFPFFFDPGWNVRVRPIEGVDVTTDDRDARWDGASVHAFEGTYGDYVLRKVSHVFPHLGRENL